MAAGAGEIEYVYSAHSAYAYLGSRTLMEVAARTGRTIRHRPTDLRRIVQAYGAPDFRQRSKAHLRYFFGREIERWAEHRNAPVAKLVPTHHHHDITLPNCFLIAAMERGHVIDELAHALLEAHWRDDADLADPDTLARLAAALDIDPAPLLADTDTSAIRTLYERYTDEAIARGVPGSPAYFVDGDMFYGQDRLELVERACARPYARPLTG
jgi:2-hydroxychromene-2-carboxylate isomerase